jgi:hypothetical protein
VSLWTFQGRLKNVPFTGSPDQLKVLAEHQRGECDLLRREGTWYLMVTVTVPDSDVYEPDGFLGVDLGIVNIATTSDGEIMAGRRLNRYRRRQQRLRAKLQSKGTTSAKRVLKRQRRKESRRARDANHVISKRIVTEAERTGRGISLEDLRGIRERVRPARRPPPPSTDACGAVLSRRPNGSRCTAGPSPSSDPSSPTRPSGPVCRWCR